MEDYQRQVQQVIGVLTDSGYKIDKILSDENLMHLKNKLLRDIDRMVSTISIQHGFEYEVKYTDAPAIAAAQPLRKVMGRLINPAGPSQERQLISGKPKQQQPIQKTAQEVEADEFEEKALDLYAKFNTITDEAILDQFEDMVIRGVGTIAGLPVTENHPKKVDVKFVKEIKDAITKQLDLQNASQKAAGDLHKNDDELGEDNLGEKETNASLAGERGNETKKASVDGPVNELNQNTGSDGKATETKKITEKK